MDLKKRLLYFNLFFKRINMKLLTALFAITIMYLGMSSQTF